MNCPICNVQLNMSERQGVEIDYCPQCRGIWLDRGELDKILERSKTEFHTKEYKDRHYDDHKGHGNYIEYDNHYKKRKKRSFLEDIFDFD